jgi:TRAP-type C4-dicarboxylate transport system permease small subunit
MNQKNSVNLLGVFSYALSRLGCLALFTMMCLTVVDVIGRYAFNTPILGAFEMTEFLVLVTVFSFLGYAQSQKSHVTVDIIFTRFTPNTKRIVSTINYLVSLIVVFVIAWMGFQKAVEAYHTGEKPLNLSIPDYPFIFFLSFGAAVMCIEFIRDIIRKLNQTGGKNP